MSTEFSTVEAVDQPKPAQIPIPENFPVTWQSPDDIQGFWMLERMHWPDPQPPLDYEVMRDAHEQFTWAFQSYGVPLQYEVRYLNYYWYFAVTPSVEDHSEMPARMQTGLENLGATVLRLQELWSAEWLPEVKEHLAYWEAFDLEGASMNDLLAHLEETVRRHKRVWQIHFLQTFPVYMAMDSFDELYRDLFGAERSLEAYELLQGFENKTVDLGRALWQLSRDALASETVHSLLEQSEIGDIIPALEASAEGRNFLVKLEQFLSEYGQRSEGFGVSFTSWIEDPTAAIQQLLDYVHQPELDFEAERAALAAARERHIKDALARLEGYPQPVIDQFNSSLRLAQQATVISEDHAYYIDLAAIHQVRQVLVEFGRRFATAGVIGDAADIFYLKIPEIRETAQNLPGVGRSELVARRTAEIDHFRTISAPPVLGTPPDGPPPEDPLSRTVGKFFGAPPTGPEQENGALVLRGGSGSPGSTQGIARIVNSLAEATKLGDGEILIAPTTAPAWTPLFATAAAIVTDTGGVLSHCAVVAREYGIPAVVGTGAATAVIEDGQTIEVDGDQGMVRVVLPQ